MGLAGKIALITGSGRGIGRATAEYFCEQGAKVIITSRSAQELGAVVTQPKQSEHIKALAGNIADPKFCKALFEFTKETFGPPDILVNNAGTICVQAVENLSLEAWDQMMTVNVRSAFILSQLMFQLPQASNDHRRAIINISSLGGIRGTEKFPGFSGYVASKFAIAGLTEALAVEGKPKNIRVNAIAPGAVKTRMLEEAAPGLNTSTGPMDIARIIAYLADDEAARAINGTIVEVYSND